MSPLYPLFHKLENRQVVVIGAGSVALRRIRRLLACGARVTVISPEALAEIAELEQSVAQYKEEYATLIAQVEAIKGEMALVETKAERSTKMLESLSSERTRSVSHLFTFFFLSRLYC